MNMRTSVFVTFQVAGFHNWPDAPTEFDYLRDKHRHVFHVRVDVRVNHSDRDVEFIDFKATAQEGFKRLAIPDCAYPPLVGLSFGNQSCERLAQRLLYDLRLRHHTYDVLAVEVSEDGENGARQEYVGE